MMMMVFSVLFLNNNGLPIWKSFNNDIFIISLNNLYTWLHHWLLHNNLRLLNKPTSSIERLLLSKRSLHHWLSVHWLLELWLLLNYCGLLLYNRLLLDNWLLLNNRLLLLVNGLLLDNLLLDNLLLLELWLLLD